MKNKIIVLASILTIFMVNISFALILNIEGKQTEYTGPNVNLKINDHVFIPSGDQMPPIIIESRTLVPVREVFELLGGNVSWNPDTKTVTIVSNNITVDLTINSNISTVNGVATELDVPAKIINNKTMVPVRFISEKIGFKVDWDSETSTVFISTPLPTTDPVGSQNIIDVTNDEENIVIQPEISIAAQRFNEKYSKSFGENKGKTVTYQLLDLIITNNLAGSGKIISVEFENEKGEKILSDEVTTLSEIKSSIIKFELGRYAVSGEYSNDGYLSKVNVKRLISK